MYILRKLIRNSVQTSDPIDRRCGESLFSTLLWWWYPGISSPSGGPLNPDLAAAWDLYATWLHGEMVREEEEKNWYSRTTRRCRRGICPFHLFSVDKCFVVWMSSNNLYALSTPRISQLVQDTPCLSNKVTVTGCHAFRVGGKSFIAMS